MSEELNKEALKWLKNTADRVMETDRSINLCIDKIKHHLKDNPTLNEYESFKKELEIFHECFNLNKLENEKDS